MLAIRMCFTFISPLLIKKKSDCMFFNDLFRMIYSEA